MVPVSLLRATSYDLDLLREKVVALLEPLGGIEAFVKPGDRVLLKPNLLTGARPTKECTTRPELVRVVAELVLAAGGQPFLGDSPAFGSAAGVAKANGLAAIAQELEIPIVEFRGQRYDSLGGEFGHLRLSKEAMDADVVINLPKVKSHCQLTITLGVKNLFGCVPGKLKAWWHLDAGKDAARFGRMLVETAQTIAPNLTIIDGIIGHEGNGPSNGEPRLLGLLGASANVFALDQALLDILQVQPERVPTAAAALALGVCPDRTEVAYPLAQPAELAIDDWQLSSFMIPIDFGLPRVVRSTFKHLYIKLVKERFSNRELAGRS
ncbi:MAG: DUF362 domain-containing protein [Oscillatoriales cyanobacterium]|nr:MAG: DUF362 domain-containing protein [Oscillatoriales cyanobacterium]